MNEYTHVGRTAPQAQSGERKTRPVAIPSRKGMGSYEAHANQLGKRYQHPPGAGADGDQREAGRDPGGAVGAWLCPVPASVVAALPAGVDLDAFVAGLVDEIFHDLGKGQFSTILAVCDARRAGALGTMARQWKKEVARG